MSTHRRGLFLSVLMVVISNCIGFDGSFGGWDSQTFIGGTEGLDVQHSVSSFFFLSF